MSGWMNTHFGPWAFALSLIKACYLASYPAEIRQGFGGSFWRFYKTINLNTSGSIPIISAPQRQAAKHSPQAWDHFQAPRWGYNPAKIGSDFATGHSKIMQKKSEDYDDDGSHNSAFKTLQLSIRGGVIFRNASPGGSELLWMTSKTLEKDSKERMAANMKMIDKLIENMED